MRRGNGVGFVLAAVGLWLVAWAWAVPFGGFPDELDHYLRAVSMGNGQVIGHSDPQAREESLERVPKTCCVDGNAASVAWVRRGNRFVEVPGRLRPEAIPCDDVVRNP